MSSVATVNRRFPCWVTRWIPVEEHGLQAAAIADWTSMKVNRAESGVIVAGVELVSSIVAHHR